jgi:arylsulfatase A-like enzyme
MPLIIYGPEESGRCDTVVSNIDIPPTIVDLFGLAPVDAFEGQSLVPTAGYEARGAYGEAIDQRAKKGGDVSKDVYFYREGPLKLIHRPGVDGWELYDLDVDPGEQKNIYETSSSAAQRLASKLLPKVRRWEA